MARKIFVSYKHSDRNVYPLPDGVNGTARDYVDYLEELFDGEEIYKGERADEDLSGFTDDTIRSQLRDQIFDSTVTVVLISRGMVVEGPERDQFIPWEISYALQRRRRGDRVSDTNAILAVVVPNSLGTYSHFIQERECNGCTTTTLLTDNTFKIIGNNMFNKVEVVPNTCAHCYRTSYRGDHSYIPYVRWHDFIANPDEYISRAQSRKDNIDSYEICKYLED